MIILLGSQKGGVGKTTLALNLAVEHVVRGHDVVLVDADKQGSANSWSGARAESAPDRPSVHCVQKTGVALGPAAQELQRRYGDVIIDAGGRDSPELRAGLVVANLVLFPLQASVFDIETLGVLDELVATARGMNPGLAAAVVLNRVSPNPRVAEQREARAVVEQFSSLLLCETAVSDRVVFRSSARDGLGVCEHRPRDPAACREVSALYDEVFAGG